MHASSCGNVERAILYAEKALQIMNQQPDGINYLHCAASPTGHTAGVNVHVFNMLRAHIMETMISCKLVEGKYTESLNLVCVCVCVRAYMVLFYTIPMLL